MGTTGLIRDLLSSKNELLARSGPEPWSPDSLWEHLLLSQVSLTTNLKVSGQHARDISVREVQMVSKPRLHTLGAAETVVKVTLVWERMVHFLLVYFGVSD